MRSIKPEMFRSLTVSGWPVPVRWTFAGLLTYLDDEGRGADDARLIKAEIYPLDDDMTARKVEQHLSTVVASGPLCRYEIGGRRYLHITSWSEHQRINRATKSKHPHCPLHEPSLNGSPPPHGGRSEDSPSTHDRGSEGSHPRAQAGAPAEHGAREQGSKGARESATRVVAERPSADVIPLAAPVTAQTLIAEWIDHCPHRPPGQVVGQVAKLLGQMLAEGIPGAVVRDGLARWHQAASAERNGRHAATLPSFVHAAGAGPPRSTADQRFADGMALAAKYAALDAEEAR